MHVSEQIYIRLDFFFTLKKNNYIILDLCNKTSIHILQHTDTHCLTTCSLNYITISKANATPLQYAPTAILISYLLVSYLF